jgi:hypothetical protein
MPKKLVDYLAPQGDPVQIILKRKGKPVSGIYVDGKKEIRSPDLERTKKNDQTA